METCHVPGAVCGHRLSCQLWCLSTVPCGKCSSWQSWLTNRWQMPMVMHFYQLDPALIWCKLRNSLRRTMSCVSYIDSSLMCSMLVLLHLHSFFWWVNSYHGVGLQRRTRSMWLKWPKIWIPRLQTSSIKLIGLMESDRSRGQVTATEALVPFESFWAFGYGEHAKSRHVSHGFVAVLSKWHALLAAVFQQQGHQAWWRYIVSFSKLIFASNKMKRRFLERSAAGSWLAKLGLVQSTYIFLGWFAIWLLQTPEVCGFACSHREQHEAHFGLSPKSARDFHTRNIERGIKNQLSEVQRMLRTQAWSLGCLRKLQWVFERSWILKQPWSVLMHDPNLKARFKLVCV